jgi:hypothetical protein
MRLSDEQRRVIKPAAPTLQAILARVEQGLKLLGAAL